MTSAAPTEAETTLRIAGATAESPVEILGFGHPLLDISCAVDKSFLARYGMELASVNLARDDQMSIFEELSQLADVEFVPGGACMNSIRVARWLLRKDVSTFIGCLGSDEFASILERALTKAGVKSIFQRNTTKPTGTCACLIVERERSLLANLGAALELDMNHMQSEAVQRAMAAAEIFYLEGFFMNVVSSPLSSIAIGEHAEKHNKIFCFNLSAPYLSQFFQDKLKAILPFADVLFGSHLDFTAFAETQGWETTDMGAMLMKCVNMPKRNARRPRMVVMTNGSEPTLVAAGGRIREFRPLRVREEDIVDTNGAGDAFVGGFLSQIAKGRDLDHAVHTGHAAASIIIQHNGCTMPQEIPAVLADA
jgi:adenosine kinase